MSSADVSRPNCDIVNISLEQQGKPELSVFFKKPFIDENRHYVCCVSNLSVPMMATRMLPATALQDLFYILRRNAGQDITNANHTALNGNGAINGQGLDAQTIALMDQNSVGTFHVRSIPMLNISDFLILLNGFSAVFENRIAEAGIAPLLYGATAVAADGTPTPVQAIGTDAGDDPVPMLRFGLSPSGVLIITLSALFSNHFYIDFTEMGKTLLGLNTYQIAVTQNQVTGVISRFGEGLHLANVIQPATVTVPVPIYGNLSLLSTLESRLSVHLESDLPITKTIVSQNQEEKSAYDLASFVLKNESSSTIYISGTKVDNEFAFRTHTHSGQLVLQSRAEQPTQYSPLLHTLDLRTLRLRLYLKTREYNPTTKQWIVSKKAFPMEESDHWSCDLRFISTE